VISSVLSVGLNLIFNLWAVHSFGFWGLALGTSLAAALNFLFLMIVVGKKFAERGVRLETKALAGSFTAMLVLALLMGVLCFVYTEAWNVWIPLGVDASVGLRVFWRSVRVFSAIFLGIGFFVGTGKAFKIKDIEEIADFFLKKLRIKVLSK
jgi:peptidoglycan biosynthesis protein MviN/MurJ (putative lipid II flippase)